MIGSGSSDLAIGISLILRDQFSGTAAAANRELASLSEGAQSAVSSFQSAQRDFSAGATAIGAGAIAVMANMTKVGADFDATLTYISKIASEKGGVGFDKLSQRALQLGQDSMYSAGQVADAMKYLAMSGMDTEAIYNNVAGAVALASATMSQLEGKLGTADIMTNIMHAFKIEGTEANAMHVADVLSKAVTSSNTNLLDFAEGMKYAQGTAHSLGLSLEETAAIIMMMGNAGIQGSMSGTATENMLRYLSRMGDEARSGTRQGKALSSLGLGPEDLKTASGDLKSIHEIFTLISRQLQGMGDLDAVNLIQDMFGVRGARAAVLMREINDYAKNLDILENSSAGTALTNQQAMMATTKGLIDEATGSLETLAVAWFHNIRPVLDPLIKTFAQAVEFTTKLIQTPVGKWTTILISGLIVIGTTFMGIRTTLLTLRIAQQKFNAAVVSTGAAGKTASATMSAGAGTYNGILSQTLAKLQTKKASKLELVNIQRQYTAELLKTAMAENAAAVAAGKATALTAAQRAQLARTATMTTSLTAQQQMLLGASGVTAAGGIGAWLARRGIGRFTTVDAGGRMRDTRTGRFVSAATSTPGYSLLKPGSAIGKVGGVLGKGGGLPAMLGGMVAGMGADAAGRDTGLGKGLGILGSTLSGAGTGAMIGSFVPILGNGVGAIVGGIGGLLWGLYDNLSKIEDEVTSAEENAKQQMSSGEFWKDSVWKEKTRKLLDMEDGSTAYVIGGRQTMWLGPQEQAMLNQSQMNSGVTRVVINIDGRSAMDREIKKNAFEEMINLLM